MDRPWRLRDDRSGFLEVDPCALAGDPETTKAVARPVLELGVSEADLKCLALGLGLFVWLPRRADWRRHGIGERAASQLMQKPIEP